MLLCRGNVPRRASHRHGARWRRRVSGVSWLWCSTALLSTAYNAAWICSSAYRVTVQKCAGTSAPSVCAAHLLVS